MPRKSRRFIIDDHTVSIRVAEPNPEHPAWKVQCPYCHLGDLALVLSITQYGFWFNLVWHVYECEDCHKLCYVMADQENGMESIREPEAEKSPTETPQL